MYIYGIQDAAGAIHYVGLTTRKVNLRFNWHVWAARHPKSTYHRPFHKWMAAQDITKLKVVVLEQVSTFADLAIAERDWYAKLKSEGNPLKCSKRCLGVGHHHIGSKRSPEHLAALNKGRRKSARKGNARHAATAHLY